MVELEDKYTYFRAVVSDAIKLILKDKTAYCFSQEQVDAIKDTLLKKHKIKNVYVHETDGIFYINKLKERK